MTTSISTSNRRSTTTVAKTALLLRSRLLPSSTARMISPARKRKHGIGHRADVQRTKRHRRPTPTDRHQQDSPAQAAQEQVEQRLPRPARARIAQSTDRIATARLEPSAHCERPGPKADDADAHAKPEATIDPPGRSGRDRAAKEQEKSVYSTWQRLNWILREPWPEAGRRSGSRGDGATQDKKLSEAIHDRAHVVDFRFAAHARPQLGRYAHQAIAGSVCA